MASLRLKERNLHVVGDGDRRVLFHVPTTGLFDLDGLAAAVIDGLRDPGGITGLAALHGDDAVAGVLTELEHLDLVDGGQAAAAPARRPDLPEKALTTLVLNVTTGCNLACTYCYKEDLGRPVEARELSAGDAERAIDLLMEESGERPRVNVTFFGGEPLSNMKAIVTTVAYADRRAAEAGKAVDYALTTNATLLDDDGIDYFDRHRFALTVSIDGPAAVHDRNRRTRSGKGTYATVQPRISRLLDRYRSRPVGARVTLAGGVTDVVAIHRHLKHELGFAEVGFAPVTAGLPAGFGLDDGETRAMLDGLIELGRQYRDAALAGRNLGFSNMSQLMVALHEGSSKLIPCGAGVALLAVDPEGGLRLCHRFTGSRFGAVGDVRTGIDRPAITSFLDRALERSHGLCGDCRARHLCAGGCYHESYTRHGDPFRPTDHYCDLMREWIDFGIGAYAAIMAGNPDFLRTLTEPRRATT